MPPQFQEATHANVSVVVLHDITFAVHHSVTGIPHYRPSTNILLQLAVFSSSNVCWRIATSVYKYSSCRTVVYTACVMLSVDSTRRESHAMAKDIFRLPTQNLNLLRHDLRVPVGSLLRFKLSLPQCNVPDVLNCMSGRLSRFPSLYWRYLCNSYENYNYWQNPKVNTSSNIRHKVSGKFMFPPS